jgi:hypothetical protein
MATMSEDVSPDGLRDEEWSLAVLYVTTAARRDGAELRAVASQIQATDHRHEFVWMYLLCMARAALLRALGSGQPSRESVLRASRNIYPAWSFYGTGTPELLDSILLTATEQIGMTPEVMDAIAFIGMAVVCLVSETDFDFNTLRPEVAARIGWIGIEP